MPEGTIDHIISLTIFLAALLIFIGFYNQTIQTAILYQRHKYLATKCSDLLDNMLLNPGSPSNTTCYWGTSDCNITGFGLQDPDSSTYSLNAFALMKLLSSNNQVYYSQTGGWYNNVTWGLNGGYLLVPATECVNYSTVTKLLGINGTFGAYLEITPTVAVKVDETGLSPLSLSVQVSGQGSPVSNASLTWLMFWTNSTGSGKMPLTNSTYGILQADSTGKATLSFPSTPSFPYLNVANNGTAYSFIVKTSVSGISGIGYKSRNVYINGAGNVVPFVNSVQNGTVLLTHNFEYNPQDSQGSLNFNATFYGLPDNLTLAYPVINVTGTVNTSGGIPFQSLTIPVETSGFLIVAYNETINQNNIFGITIMPWGIDSIGLSTTIGDNPSTSSKEWVAADMREVVVDGIAYQAKLLLWDLQGYQVVK
jgi:hypothetical protein